MPDKQKQQESNPYLDILQGNGQQKQAPTENNPYTAMLTPPAQNTQAGNNAKEPSQMDDAIQGMKDFGYGATGGLAHTLNNIGSLLVPDAALRALHMPVPTKEYEDSVFAPRGTAQKLGYAGEQAAEYMTPMGEETGASKMARILQNAGKAGLLSTIQNNGDTSHAIPAALLGGAGGAASEYLLPGIANRLAAKSLNVPNMNADTGEAILSTLEPNSKLGGRVVSYDADRLFADPAGVRNGAKDFSRNLQAALGQDDATFAKTLQQPSMPVQLSKARISQDQWALAKKLATIGATEPRSAAQQLIPYGLGGLGAEVIHGNPLERIGGAVGGYALTKAAQNPAVQLNAAKGLTTPAAQAIVRALGPSAASWLEDPFLDSDDSQQ